MADDAELYKFCQVIASNTTAMPNEVSSLIRIMKHMVLGTMYLVNVFF